MDTNVSQTAIITPLNDILKQTLVMLNTLYIFGSNKVFICDKVDVKGRMCVIHKMFCQDIFGRNRDPNFRSYSNGKI